MLRIHLLGHLRLFIDQQPLSFSALPKVLPLWAYLLLRRGQPVLRDTLAFSLWPDLPETEARNNLRRHLYDLRRVLPVPPDSLAWVLSDRESVQWNLHSPHWLDVAEFEHLSTDPARWAEAVTFYTGDLLPELYDDWLIVERERLRERQMETLARLVTQRRAQYDLAQASDYARQLLALDPLREETLRTLMTVRQEAGDRTGALKEYQAFEERLREELGVAPMPETLELYARIKAGELASEKRSAPVSTPPHNLPAALTSFLGRLEELAALQQLLEAQARLITLTGPGGSGKTRLALEAARRALTGSAAHFPDGVFLIRLADITDPAFIPQAIANVLGVKEGQRTLMQGLEDFLRAKNLLLVLDNFEQIVEAAPLVADLLTAAPGLRVLVTSRSVLSLYGEQEFPVPPLPLPDLEPLPPAAELLRYAAIALFVERARAADPYFTLRTENAPAVAGICHRLEGLPLALELAAARSKLFTPQAMLERLSQQLNFLTSAARNLAARQRTLRQTIDWSYHLLSDDEKRCFAQLGVFTGNFTCAAAEAVAGQPLPEVLEALADKSMLRRMPPTEPPDAPRFRLLLTLREYALEQLAARADVDRARERLIRYYLEVLSQAEPEFGAEQARWLRLLEAEHDNLRSALDWSLSASGQSELGLRLAVSLAEFWKTRGYLSEGRRWLNAALERCPEVGPDLRAQALRSIGSLALMQGDYAEAQARSLASEALWRSLGPAGEAGLAATLRNLGIVAWARDELASALTYYEQCLALERKLDNRLGIAGLLNNIGLVRQRQGDYAAASTHYQDSLVAARALGNQRLIANVLNNLGITAQEQGRYAEACAALQEAIVHYRELGDKIGIANGLNNLSNAARPLGELDVARASAEESARLYQELGHEGYRSSALFMLGAAAHRQGDQAAARAYFEQSLALRIKRGDQRAQLTALEGLAWVENAEGRPARAARLLAAANALRDPLGAPVRSIPNRAEYERAAAAIQANLSPATFAAEWEAGRALTLEAAIAYARQTD